MIRSIILTTALVAVLQLVSQPALPPPPANVAANLATLSTNFRINETIAPGLIVRIYNPGNWEWSFADGIRNVGTGSPATPGLVFRAASLSKIFCATAVLKLASEGTLSLDDNIGEWLPASYVAQIENNSQITIRRLLTHTSGLDEPQFGTSLAGNFLGAPQINYRDSILQIIANQSGSPFGVGNFYYSNANFNLLAEIVKNASGIPYQQYLQQAIIQPLGLSETYLDSLPLATGFNGYIPCITLVNCPLPDPFTLLDYSQANVGWGYGAADISSTTKDLIQFYYALQNGQIIPPNWVDSLTAHSVDAANSFANKRYGYGTMLFQRNGAT
ncbi:MAG: class A beta-lactamase-related serine hydrolase, partial [Bacteroidetes bacterium]